MTVRNMLVYEVFLAITVSDIILFKLYYIFAQKEYFQNIFNGVIDIRILREIRVKCVN